MSGLSFDVAHISGTYFGDRAAAETVTESYRRLEAMRDDWQEVYASESLHRTAARLLKTHPLRAGDAVQLAAAPVVPLPDRNARLKQAAEGDGFVFD